MVVLVLLATIVGIGAGAAGLFAWQKVVAPTGTLVVENLPTGGTVLVDTKPAARQAIRLSEGRHEVEILAPGMESHTEQVTITANTTLRIQYPAQPLAPAEPQ